MQTKDINLTKIVVPLAVLAMLISGTALMAAEARTKNVIRNPGFEELNANGTPVAWSWYNNMGLRPTPQTYFEVDTNTYNVLPFCKGGFTAKLVNGKEPEGSKAVTGGFIQGKIPVQGGADYLLSFKHIESEGFDANLYICITQFDANTNSISGASYYFATNVQPGHSWRVWSRTFTPKSATVAIDLIFVPNGKGTSWFDDISLVKIQNDQP